jgi:transposase
MPTGRLNMRRIRDVLRLKFGQGLSERQIVSSLGLGKGSVGSYVRRAQRAGLSWPLPDGLDDDSLELLLFPAAPTVPDPDRPVPDWAKVDQELRRPGVTRMLLWEEYRAAHPEGFAYTWFCTHFEAWKGRVRPTMRQTHVGGEKVFVDFAGDTVDVIDPATGEAHAMKLFVATMGASNFTYAEAVASEGLEDWICAHARMFAFLGGAPRAVVPDNLKSAVFNGNPSGASLQTPRQGEGRGCGAGSAALDPGSAQECAVLLVAGIECRGPTACGRVEHARDARLWRQPRRSVRHDRPPAPAAAAAAAL